MEVISIMKKVMSFLCSIALTFTLVVPAASAAPVHELNSSEDNISLNQSKSTKSIIDVVESYVKVNQDGLIEFKNVPNSVYIKYNLSELQKHFDSLNAMVQNGTIVINSDLSVVKQTMSTMAYYGSWDYHWWGYDRNFGNSETKEFVDYCDSVAGGTAIVTGASFMFPPVSAIFGVTTGYFTLLGSRVTANNKGNGVYIGVTWVAAFNVSPL